MAGSYACRISRENMGAIASENPKFDREEALNWLDEHGSGYFLRDESSPFDCAYMEDTVFHQIYAFEGQRDKNEIFRRVLKL